MDHHPIRTLLLALGLAILGSISALAQNPAPAAPAPGGAAPANAGRGGGGGGRGGAPALSDLATARKMVDAAEVAANAAGLKVAMAVVDANGDLVYFRRMDGAIAAGVTAAPGEARAAILFGVPTKQVADAAEIGRAHV